MLNNWNIYITFGVVAYLLSLVCEKFNIIKSKPLRIFTVIFVASALCWVIYNLVV